MGYRVGSVSYFMLIIGFDLDEALIEFDLQICEETKEQLPSGGGVNYTSRDPIPMEAN